MAEHNSPGSSGQQKSSILAPRFRQNFSRRTELAGDPSFVTLTITIKDDSSRRARSRLTTFRRLVLGGRRKNLRGTQLKDKSKSILCPFAPADCPALMATALLSRSPMLQLLYPARYPETTEMKSCTAAKPVQQLSPIRRRLLYPRLMRRPRSLTPTCKGAATQRGITLVRFPRQLISTLPVCQVARLHLADHLLRSSSRLRCITLLVLLTVSF